MLGSKRSNDTMEQMKNVFSEPSWFHEGSENTFKYVLGHES